MMGATNGTAARTLSWAVLSLMTCMPASAACAELVVLSVFALLPADWPFGEGAGSSTEEEEESSSTLPNSTQFKFSQLYTFTEVLHEDPDSLVPAYVLGTAFMLTKPGPRWALKPPNWIHVHLSFYKTMTQAARCKGLPSWTSLLICCVFGCCQA